ncbi:hypothetical protein INT43_008925 [Umbelopsis isabellina]|uniref:Acid phosphatase n=1 Tax=Mortierella isabellina TaxID=91625 RepID=A0A8H7UGZ2_MORIS|nr:hypothetical protein INT43_008925 [Umbelopsis isabellina]
MVSWKFVTGVIAAAAAVVSAAPLEKRIVSGKNFDHFMVIVLENEDYAAVMADSYFSTVAAKHNGNLLTNYQAITHPSQPNYIAMIGGSTLGFSRLELFIIKSNFFSKSIVDILEPAGITWKEYAENYTQGSNGACNTATSLSNSLYMRKHNPFISFTTVTSNASRCKNIVPATQLQTDINSGSVPQFMFYTPNMNDDGHDTSLSTASKWTKGFLEPLLSNTAFNKNLAVLITWDETKDYDIPNQVWSVLVGSSVKALANNTDNTAYNHYSILATVEENWSLGNLGQGDVSATPFNI